MFAKSWQSGVLCRMASGKQAGNRSCDAMEGRSKDSEAQFLKGEERVKEFVNPFTNYLFVPIGHDVLKNAQNGGKYEFKRT